VLLILSINSNRRFKEISAVEKVSAEGLSIGELSTSVTISALSEVGSN